MKLKHLHLKFYFDIEFNRFLFGFTFWGRDYIREINFNFGPLRLGIWITKGE